MVSDVIGLLVGDVTAATTTSPIHTIPIPTTTTIIVPIPLPHKQITPRCCCNHIPALHLCSDRGVPEVPGLAKTVVLGCGGGGVYRWGGVVGGRDWGGGFGGAGGGVGC